LVPPRGVVLETWNYGVLYIQVMENHLISGKYQGKSPQRRKILTLGYGEDGNKQIERRKMLLVGSSSYSYVAPSHASSGVMVSNLVGILYILG